MIGVVREDDAARKRFEADSQLVFDDARRRTSSLADARVSAVVGLVYRQTKPKSLEVANDIKSAAFVLLVCADLSDIGVG